MPPEKEFLLLICAGRDMVVAEPAGRTAWKAMIG